MFLPYLLLILAPAQPTFDLQPLSLLPEAMSNTFDGILREFPYISLDKFNCGTEISLLTHCHMDHLAGILNRLFLGIVYCTELTKKLLQADKRYEKVMRRVEVLPLNTRTRLVLPGSINEDVFVTPIEAYHCLGACMFLVEREEDDCSCKSLKIGANFCLAESHNLAILCTGDVRAEQWWCDGLRQLPFLQPYLSGDKCLDNIYIDTTFYYRQEPYIEIPPNNLGIYAMICLLKEYPMNDPEIIFEFTNTTLGFEQVWAFVLSYFRGCLVATDEKFRRRLQISCKHDKIHGCVLHKSINQNHELSPLFHVGRTYQPYTIRMNEFINFNIMDFAGICCPILVKNIPTTEPLELLHTTAKGNRFYYFRDRTWLLPKDGIEMLPQDLTLVFSRHLSYTETVEFIKMFKPKQVFPCCHSRVAWKAGFHMRRLYGDICSGDQFLFDEMMLKNFGHPPKHILQRGVATVNRWSIEQCEQEQAFIEDTTRSPALIQLRKVTRAPVFQKVAGDNPDAPIFNKKGEFVLQKLVERRQEQSYKDFIEYQQSLYYKKYNQPQYVPLAPNKRGKISRVTLGGLSDYSSHSSDSSIDLLDATRMRKERNESDSARTGGTGSMVSFETRKELRSSFIASSFGSFEESVPVAAA